MSRNFEVLEQLQQDQELFRVPPIREPLGHNRATVTRPLDTDEFLRQELIGLAQLLFLTTDPVPQKEPRQIVFCGIDETEGAALLCARLGQILASRVASQVCIVDANVRGSVLYQLLESGPNLAQPTAQAALLQQIASNLWLISCHFAANGGEEPATLDRVRLQIKGLSHEFAYVVINAPPVARYNDAVVLGQEADGVVLVLEANFTRRVAARRAKQTLEAGNARVLGTVLNNRTFPIPQKIYRVL
jgi:MinD-like ATPase involved in chromosome partitioning or flagellar assembly